jgi:probable rRNA maturation factor
MEITVLYDEGLEGHPPPAEWLRNVVEQALTAENASPASEVSVLITGQDRIHELNRTYLDEDRPTDVLSFPMVPPGDNTGFIAPPDGLVHLGEIVISLPQATEQAREHAHSTQREIAILTIHGVLHLLGYDHAEPEEETRMKKREGEILEICSKET